MQTQLSAILGRIETDLALLRQQLDVADADDVRVPVLQSSYTPAEATRAKAEIEAAFRAGVLSYDKKRGMKRSVTIRVIPANAQ